MVSSVLLLLRLRALLCGRCLSVPYGRWMSLSSRRPSVVGAFDASFFLLTAGCGALESDPWKTTKKTGDEESEETRRGKRTRRTTGIQRLGRSWDSLAGFKGPCRQPEDSSCISLSLSLYIYIYIYIRAMQPPFLASSDGYGARQLQCI